MYVLALSCVVSQSSRKRQADEAAAVLVCSYATVPAKGGHKPKPPHAKKQQQQRSISHHCQLVTTHPPIHLPSLLSPYKPLLPSSSSRRHPTKRDTGSTRSLSGQKGDGQKSSKQRQERSNAVIVWTILLHIPSLQRLRCIDIDNSGERWTDSRGK